MPRPADESQIPVPRNTHALAYDPDTDRVVLFGGDNGLVSLDDTWIYDYGANRWTRVETDVHPSARDYGQLAYDRDSRRMVLFGGLYWENSEEILCEPETWTFDLATLTWEKMAPPTSPTARAWHGMAYSDAARAVADRQKTGILPRAEESARTLERTFQLGEAGILDVIDARRVLLEARREYLSSARERDVDCGALVLLSGRELP